MYTDLFELVIVLAIGIGNRNCVKSWMLMTSFWREMLFEPTDLLSHQDDITSIHDFTRFWSPVSVVDMDNHLKKVCMCPRVL